MLAPTAFRRPVTPLTAAQRDSALLVMMFVNLPQAIARVKQAATQEFYKEEASREARGRDEHRQVAVYTPATASINVPLFSRGPSKTQRMRDSVILEGNLAGLRVLQARAKARLDSIRVDDSLARANKLPIP